MAQVRQMTTTGTNRATQHKNSGGNRRESSIYVYGNAARQIDIQRQLEEEPRKRLSHETRKNREKASHMSLGYVMFLMGALVTCALILANYIQLQSELTSTMTTVSRLEREVNALKLSNDEEYSRITSNVDLEEIKRIAIGELGMTYAKEGQIITYVNEGNDYMRQVTNKEH